ncbi:conserved hypothetical protein [Ricinus communis]|uniref:RNase H type-1 domain-containing protein n=1 Tax=Ricinus communis TaxID=3988 RepID=B9SFL8_RICCO|nr:conserved hypothetical protein [Ricinus communis]
MGGLGFKNMKYMNLALLMKLGHSSASPLWRAVANLWAHLIDALSWSIGNGGKVRFWLDNWCNIEQPLVIFTNNRVPPEMLEDRLSKFLDANGQSHWERISLFLPHSIVLHITSMLPPRLDVGDDRVYWRYTSNGQFNMKSACKALYSQRDANLDMAFSLAWKWEGPQRIQTFYGFRCNMDVEDTLHVLRDCPYAKHLHIGGDLDWECIFGVTVCRLWKWRNEDIFQNNNSRRGSRVRDIMQWSSSIMTTRGGNSVNAIAEKCKTTKMILWQAPTEQWFKLNTDGAYAQRVKKATARMENGWVGLLCTNCYANIISEIHRLLQRNWQVKVSHVYREANFAADFMAGMALSLSTGVHCFSEPPLGIGAWLSHNII